MKKSILKLFSFIVALYCTFTLTACDTSGGGGGSSLQSVPTEQAIELFSDLIDFNNSNITITVDANYLLSKQETSQSAVETIEDSLEDVVFKLDGGNMYMLIPNDEEGYKSNGYTYGREYLESDWSDYFINYNSETEADNIFGNYVDNVEGLVQELFLNVVSFNPSWVSAQQLENEAYKLNINANLKNDLNAYKLAITKNLNSDLETVLNALLAVHYGNTLSISKLVDDIKQNITAESTLEDVITFVGTEFGFTTTNLVSFLSLILSEESENAPSLDTNFFAMVQIDSNETFALFIDDIVNNYLRNDELTLNTFLTSIDETNEETSEFLIVLKNVILSLENITINTCNIDVALTTNSARTRLENLSVSVNASLGVNGMSLSAQANAYITFSEYGTTEIELPTIIEDDIEGFDFCYYFADEDLVSGTSKTIQNVNLADWSVPFTSAYQGEGEFTLIYDSTNHTLTLSADAVDYLLETHNTLLFYCGQAEDFSMVFEIN